MMASSRLVVVMNTSNPGSLYSLVDVLTFPGTVLGQFVLHPGSKKLLLFINGF